MKRAKSSKLFRSLIIITCESIDIFEDVEANSKFLVRFDRTKRPEGETLCKEPTSYMCTTQG